MDLSFFKHIELMKPQFEKLAQSYIEGFELFVKSERVNTKDIEINIKRILIEYNTMHIEFRKSSSNAIDALFEKHGEIPTEPFIHCKEYAERSPERKT